MMYLKLSVAGHLTIFQTRTRGPWWSTRPAGILLAAVGGTQVAATVIAVYGAGLVVPLGWKYAGIVWGYAVFWFLVGDPLKLLTYKVLDTFKSDTKSQIKAEPTAASIGGPEPADKPVEKASATAEGDAASSDASATPEAKAILPSENHDGTKPQGTTAAAPEAKPDADVSPETKPARKAASDSAPAPKPDSGTKPAPKAAA
jgi:H+-transporting ATPase